MSQLLTKLNSIKDELEGDTNYQNWKAQQIAQKGWYTSTGENKWLKKNRPDILKAKKSLKWGE